MRSDLKGQERESSGLEWLISGVGAVAIPNSSLMWLSPDWSLTYRHDREILDAEGLGGCKAKTLVLNIQDMKTPERPTRVVRVEGSSWFASDVM
jgi:hypothetical protein